jgi:hypothetical protein
MTKLFTGCAILCAAVALSGCASQGAAVLNDLQGCHRHYVGSISPGNVMAPIAFNGAVEIDCPVGITTGVLVKPAPDAPIPPIALPPIAPSK